MGLANGTNQAAWPKDANSDSALSTTRAIYSEYQIISSPTSPSKPQE